MKKELHESEGLIKAVAEHDGYIKRQFGGVWPAVVYAGQIALTYAIYVTSGWGIALGAGAWLLGQWTLLLTYDKYLTEMYNTKQKETVIHQYVVDNVNEFINEPASQAIDSIDNKDGTNEDE